jgi:hypothetical protein
MKHHGPNFAVYLARLINYRRPLINRLRDPAVKLDQVERTFLADVLEDRVKWPRGGSKSVAAHRKHLRVAATYLEFVRGAPRKGQIGDAEEFAADRCDIADVRIVRRHVKYAKALTDGRWRWWDMASRLARKGKIKQLHRTY